MYFVGIPAMGALPPLTSRTSKLPFRKLLLTQARDPLFHAFQTRRWVFLQCTGVTLQIITTLRDKKINTYIIKSLKKKIFPGFFTYIDQYRGIDTLVLTSVFFCFFASPPQVNRIISVFNFLFSFARPLGLLSTPTFTGLCDMFWGLKADAQDKEAADEGKRKLLPNI